MKLCNVALAGAAGLVGLGGAVGLGAWVEARAFLVHEITGLGILPAGAKPLRVLHLSDIHLMPYQLLKRRFVASLADLEPDLVINTGDNISSAASVDVLFDLLEPLMKRPGAFVFGSNDFYAPKFRNPAAYLWSDSKPQERPGVLPWWKLAEEFESHGWLNLENQAGQLKVNGLTLDFTGTSDAHLERDDYAAVAGREVSADLRIGVTHAPYQRVLNAMCADQRDIIFAGHTHGGQICLPTYHAIIDNCDLPTWQASGLSVWENGENASWLHVSAGIGTSPMAPIRLFCRPCATLLTLTAEDSVDLD